MDESRSRRAPRALAGVAASATLLWVGSVAIGGPARADTSHTCDPFAGLHHDHGPLSDPVHHNVEPVLDPYLGAGVPHQLNCATVAYVDSVVANLTGTGGP
jgi:hypothetical protein